MILYDFLWLSSEMNGWCQIFSKAGFEPKLCAARCCIPYPILDNIIRKLDATYLQIARSCCTKNAAVGPCGLDSERIPTNERDCYWSGHTPTRNQNHQVKIGWITNWECHPSLDWLRKTLAPGQWQSVAWYRLSCPAVGIKIIYM